MNVLEALNLCSGGDIGNMVAAKTIVHKLMKEIAKLDNPFPKDVDEEIKNIGFAIKERWDTINNMADYFSDQRIGPTINDTADYFSNAHFCPHCGNPDITSTVDEQGSLEIAYKCHDCDWVGLMEGEL